MEAIIKTLISGGLALNDISITTETAVYNDIQLIGVNEGVLTFIHEECKVYLLVKTVTSITHA